MSVLLDAAAAQAALGPAAELFLRESEPLPAEQLPELNEILALYLEQVRTLYEDNEFIDLGLVERIGQAVRAMLARYVRADLRTRAAIVGALRYFVIEEDAEGDLDSLLGFDDDAEVANYVIRACDLDIPLIALGEE